MPDLIHPQTIANAGTESAEQCAFFHWAAINSQTDPRLRLLFAVPNGGLRKKSTAERLKREGAKSGVPDIFFPVAIEPYHGLFIEMKLEKYRTRKNGGCSDNQLKWISNLRDQNYFCQICYSWLDAAELICKYLKADFSSITLTQFG